MNASAPELGNFSYLAPLFGAAAEYRAEDHFRLLPDPEVRSSLATDDKPLHPWGASKFISSSFSAGLLHVEALNQLVTEARQVDPVSPWTLLRAALENFATAVWLLDGKDRVERRHRTLTLWAEDFRNRADHEADVNHITSPWGRTGTERYEEVRQLAVSLGLPGLPRPSATKIITEAAATAQLEPDQTRALWRVASGFAHGRFWPNLRAAEVLDLNRGPDGYLVNFGVDDEKLEKLSKACLQLLQRAERRYRARCKAMEMPSRS
ncbi:hypothetical protein ACIOWG_27240 [Streptomyces sp. NPDC087658]|uniref:hypothetical protein n=1 Tax=unclassified Streptomyces TaxID=2593676 RepID=UPI00344B6E2F